MNKHAIWPLVGLAAAAMVVLAAGCSAPARETATGTPAGDEAFVNVTCPMMGSPIDPNNVTPELVRMHKGKKVAFCCGGCPAAWDKLSEAQKEAKLQKAAGDEKTGLP